MTKITDTFTKKLIFFIFLALSTGCFFILSVNIKPDAMILGKKPILFLSLTTVIYFELILWINNRINLQNKELSEMICVLIVILWGASMGLFFPLALTPIRTGRILLHGIYYQWMAVHVMYITGWLLIAVKVQTKITKKNFNLSMSNLFFILFIIFVSLLYDLYGGDKRYSLPKYLIQFHHNILFIGIELIYLTASVSIFIDVIMRGITKIGCFYISLFLAFLILTNPGYYIFERMRYDFIFFGPFLLFISISVEIIIMNIVKKIFKLE